MSRRRRVRTRTAVALALLAAAALAAERLGFPGLPAPAPEAGARALAEAFEAGRSDLWVEASGVVDAVLPDDRSGSRHQRFVVRLGTGQTVLVSHNIDLAPRVAELRRGDRVRFRGEYAWNDRGGVVHWTHRDPQGRRAGGWIEHRGRRYR